MRADAQRNRDRIVEVARGVFKEKGYDAPLDEIARLAGVGPGTLYRHFPTRENLIDAVQQELADRVNAMADKAIAHEGAPRERLLAWFQQYVGLLTAHPGAAARVTNAMGDEASPIASKCKIYSGANARVLDELRAEGALRDGVDDLQVVRLVGGVAAVADQSRLGPEAIHPMLEVLADGVLKP